MELFFGDEDEAFKSLVSQTRVYGEYGVGLSTEYVYQNTQAQIIAVESAPQWAAKVARGKDKARLRVYIADIGPVGRFGYPLGYTKRQNFAAYTDVIWRQEVKPDLVLIDGRFRVACFLTSLLHGPPGLQIIFDDYGDRPHYHVVEEFLAPYQRNPRQAIFERPANVDEDGLRRMIAQFRLVRD